MLESYDVKIPHKAKELLLTLTGVVSLSSFPFIKYCTCGSNISAFRKEFTNSKISWPSNANRLDEYVEYFFLQVAILEI